MSTPTDHVLDDVAAERVAQDAKWGVNQTHSDGTSEDYSGTRDKYRAMCEMADKEGRCTWRHILLEETFEALAEVDPVKLRRELVQVAAVAVNWIEDIDRKAAS